MCVCYVVGVEVGGKGGERKTVGGPIFKGTNYNFVIYSWRYLKAYSLIQRVKMSSFMPRSGENLALNLAEKEKISVLLIEFIILQKYLCLIHGI